MSNQRRRLPANKQQQINKLLFNVITVPHRQTNQKNVFFQNLFFVFACEKSYKTCQFIRQSVEDTA